MSEEKISEEVIKLLVCPSCKGDVELVNYEEDKEGLKCSSCNCIYPVRNGIPIMLVDEAVKI